MTNPFNTKGCRTCEECRQHFQIRYSGALTIVEDPTKCDYHTDYTGRAAQKERLLAEWSANHATPKGWASV